MANPIAVPGTVVSAGALVTPGGAQGVQGLQGLPGPSVVSTDANNVAKLGSDSLLYVPDPTPTIWSTRLRSFNAIGNPSFEVDQRNCGTLVSFPAGTKIALVCDRWTFGKVAATATFNEIQGTTAGGAAVPGTNYRISANYLSISVVTQQASLAAGEYIHIYQQVEGSQLRALIGDVHSISVMAYCSSPISFSVKLTDSPVTKTLTKLCTITTPSTWTLFTLPNLPVFGSGNFAILPGNIGYVLGIGIGAGSTYTSPANDTWQTGNFVCGPGCSNFAALPVNSVFNVLFVQHEPGAVCTTLIDKPFSVNLAECQRYYQKSYAYGIKAGTVASPGCFSAILGPSTDPNLVYIPFKVTLAKPPTITGYSNNSGVANAIYDATTPSDRTITAPSNIGDSAFNGFNLSGRPTTQWFCYFHYTTDTGW